MKIVSNITPTVTKYILKGISDIPAGISLDVTDLVNGKIVTEGAGVTAPVNGARKVCKQFTLLAGSTTTSLKVATELNLAKIGDILGVVGGKAYAVTAISSANGVDTITIGTAIDSVSTGDILVQCTAASATATALNVPVAILKEAFVVDTTQAYVSNGAYTHASVLKGALPASSLNVLKGIVEVSY